MTNNEARRNDKFVSAGRGNQHARRARYPDVVAALVAKLKQITNISGRQDFNLRPAAAAAALSECTKFIATAAGFVIPFSGHCFVTRWKPLAVNHDPRYSVLRCF